MINFLGPISARYASLVVQFLVIAVITRSLNSNDAGHFFVIMGIVLATYFAAGIGMPDGVVRFAPALAAHGDDHRATALIARSLKLSLLTLPIGAVAAGGGVSLYLHDAKVGWLAGLWWASYGTIFVAAQHVVACSRGELGSAMFYSAANAGQLIVTLPLILAFKLNSLDGVLAAVAAGTCFSASVCLAVAYRHCRTPTEFIDSLRDVWSQGIAIAAGRVVQSCLLWSPVWVAGFILGPEDAAVVGLACRLVSAVAAVIAAIRFSIRPSLARNAARGDWHAIELQVSRIAFFATLLAVMSIGIAATVGDTLIDIAFGANYRSAGTVTALLLFGTVGESIGGPVDEVLKMSGHAVDVIVVQTLVLILGFGALIVTGAVYGIYALALAYSLQFFVLYLALIARLWKLHGILVIPKFGFRKP
ncbi:MAG: hypothetical protein HZB45_21555 [Mycolicibacterium rufum]|nr:hypothetical protein [Mycolicibacterium rufum]